jgi:glycosyltransferase involved in cell wall biosynthesis
MADTQPLVSICIPHWQVKSLASICLRSLRQCSENYNVELLVVDNGSKDASLDWLRSLDWIRLIERPDESSDNWPRNVFTAWDCGLQAARGEFFITMHTDVFIKRDDWLDPFFREMNHSPRVAGVGAWKLDLENRFYAWQKQAIGQWQDRLRQMFGLGRSSTDHEGQFPRDYCAMYRRSVLLDHGMKFEPADEFGGGYAIAKQIWDHGYETRMIPVPELAELIVHVAHGTAAVVAEKPLRRKRAQNKVERKVARLFNEDWVQDLRNNDSLDRSRAA